MVQNVSAEDYAVLEAGPEHEHYWDTWETVLNNAVLNDGKSTYYLYQGESGDLFAVDQAWLDANYPNGGEE
jgi:hypothetical protein